MKPHCPLIQAIRNNDLDALTTALVLDQSNTNRALRWAAFLGHKECVRVLLPTAQNGISCAVNLAARTGRLDCLKILLSASTAQPNFALVQAARYGHTWCVKYLLTKADAEYSEGWAIRLAAKYGFDRCVEALFEPSRKCVQARNDEAYRNALLSTNLKSIKRLGDLGDNRIIIINDEMPEYWKNKLFAAVRQKNLRKGIEIITMCHPTVEHDIDICLCICAMFNYQQCAEFFVQRGADHTRNRHNCLRQAALNKHQSMFHYIWSLGGQETLNNDSSFMYACFKNQWWVEAQMLFEAVQCPDLRNEHLMCAAHLGHIEWVMKFLPLADPKANNSYALQYTCFSKNQEIFDILYDVSDVDVALEHVCDGFNSRFYTNRGWFIEQIQRRKMELENQLQNERLCNSIGYGHRRVKRKI